MLIENMEIGFDQNGSWIQIFKLFRQKKKTSAIANFFTSVDSQKFP